MYISLVPHPSINPTWLDSVCRASASGIALWQIEQGNNRIWFVYGLYIALFGSIVRFANFEEIQFLM
jgi:hypothetical protein